jgi:hypothetical protein
MLCMNVYFSYHLIRQEKVRLILHLSFSYRIRDPDLGYVIRDKHPGSATLVLSGLKRPVYPP